MTRKSTTPRQPRKKNIEAKPVENRNVLVPKTKGQENLIRSIIENTITFCTACSGTGKTHVSIGIACEHLLDKKIESIIVVRPLVGCGPDVGHLPGDITAKTDPYMKPVIKAFKYFLGEKTFKDYLASGKIEIATINTMRGDNIENAFLIIDEMQNCTYPQLKMLLTRLCEGSKCIVSGDISQTDLKGGSGSVRMMDELEGAKDIAMVKMGVEDIVRSGIVKTIILRTEFGDKNAGV